MKISRPNKIKRSNRFPKCNHCSSHFKEFTTHTNLHGFRYITDFSISKLERIIWIIVIIISLITCVYYICVAWIQWDEGRVIVTFDSQSTHVRQIPFPALTICPETKIRQTIFNSSSILTMKYANLSEKEKLNMEYVAQICDFFTFSNSTMKHVNESIVEFLRKVSVPFDELFYLCEWKMKFVDCRKIFVPILTDYGFCFSFNMLGTHEIFEETYVTNDLFATKAKEYMSDWNLRTGYHKFSLSETYPKRGTLPGLYGGLSILMGIDKANVDQICGGSFQGFRISLHSPTDVPRMSEDYFMLPFSQQMIVAIRPNMMYTPPGLEHLSPKKRGCFMDKERELSFFKIYSQKNCESECISNYTILVCGCVGFWMPRNKSMRICGAAKLNCLKFARVLLEEREISIGLTENKDSVLKSKTGRVFPEVCNCIPGCTSIEYDRSISQTSLNVLETAKKFHLSKNPEDIDLATIRIYFEKSQFISSKRIESSSTIDFLGNAGGIISLFIGFSILTIMEIVDYSIMRPILFAIKKRVEKRKNSRNEANL